MHIISTTGAEISHEINYVTRGENKVVILSEIVPSEPRVRKESKDGHNRNARRVPRI